MSPEAGLAVDGCMYFLDRHPKYADEKPYTLRYAPAPEDGVPQTNIEKVQYPVRFRDIRGRPDLKYDECGFGVVRLENDGMTYEDYASTEKIEGLHAAEVLDTVQRAVGAASAELIDYVVRRRHPTWPIATGDTYSSQQPASRAHIDHTYEGGRAIIREAHGEKADLVLERRWQLLKCVFAFPGLLTY